MVFFFLVYVTYTYCLYILVIIKNTLFPVCIYNKGLYFITKNRLEGTSGEVT